MPDIDMLKMVWGFILLALIGYLSHAIAVGDIREASSFGLPILLGTLVLGMDRFSSWAFPQLFKSKTEQTPPSDKASNPE